MDQSHLATFFEIVPHQNILESSLSFTSFT
jgi:hypothetical protein